VVETTPHPLPDGPLIVGLDKDDRARDALVLGQELEREFPGMLTPVYVHPLEELGALMAGAQLEEFNRLVATDTRAKHADVSALAAGMGVPDVQLREAISAAEGLHDHAVESKAALVVLGSSRRSGIGRVLPGGTAERLLSGSPVPVAVAPNGYASHQPGSSAIIGVGINVSPEAEQAVKWAADLAGRTGASLQLLAIHSPTSSGTQRAGGAFGTLTVNEVLARELRAEGERLAERLSSDLSFDSQLVSGDPGTVLVEHSRRLDLLVLGSRRYGPVKSVLLGSVSSYVLRRAYCPVVIVPRGSSGGEPADPSELEAGMT
jgi:nucleotide-binding universal stress UspA family protein